MSSVVGVAVSGDGRPCDPPAARRYSRENRAGDDEDRSGPGNAVRTPPVCRGPYPRAIQRPSRSPPSSPTAVFAGLRDLTPGATFGAFTTSGCYFFFSLRHVRRLGGYLVTAAFPRKKKHEIVIETYRRFPFVPNAARVRRKIIRLARARFPSRRSATPELEFPAKRIW